MKDMLHPENKLRMTPDFWLKTMQVSGQWSNAFKVLTQRKANENYITREIIFQKMKTT